MARIKIALPQTIHFTAVLPIRITDLNYGKHLANDKVLSLCHEARVQLLANYQYDEFNIEGIGIIMAEATIQFVKEGKFGMTLKIETTIADLSAMGFSIYYHLKDKESEKTIAKAKTGMVFYDYEQSKIAKTPAAFETKFSM